MAKVNKQVAPEWLDKIRMQKDGAEVVDPDPLAIPAGFKRPETLAEQVRRLVQRERVDESMQGEETWDEANDFNVGDDFDPSSPWETVYDNNLGRELTPAEVHEKWPEIRGEMEKRLRNYYRAQEAYEAEQSALDKLKSGSQGPPPAPSLEVKPPAKQS